MTFAARVGDGVVIGRRQKNAGMLWMQGVWGRDVDANTDSHRRPHESGDPGIHSQAGGRGISRVDLVV